MQLKYIAGLLLLVLWTSAAVAEESFSFISWFQVKPFGHKSTRLIFQGPTSEGQMPAFGFSSDFADRSGNIYFHRFNIWNGDQLQVVTVPPSPNLTRVTLRDVALSEDQKYALLASDNMEAIWFDVTAAKEVARFSGHRREGQRAAISSKSKYKAISDVRGTLWIWEEALDTPAGFFKAPCTPFKIEFTDDDHVIRIFCNERIQDWNWQTGKLLANTDLSDRISPFSFNPDGAGFSPDKKQFVGRLEKDKAIAMIDIVSGQKKWQFLLPGSGAFEDFWSSIFTPNRKCVIASTANQLFALDPETGSVLTSTHVRAGSFDLMIDPSGRYLVFPSGVEIYELPEICY